MPPRPHPLVLASLALGCAVVLALVLPHHAAGATSWRWPLRGPVVGAFHLSPRAPSRAASAAASTSRRTPAKSCALRVRAA
jgi:hypothetical protein